MWVRVRVREDARGDGWAGLEPHLRVSLHRRPKRLERDVIEPTVDITARRVALSAAAVSCGVSAVTTDEREEAIGRVVIAYLGSHACRDGVDEHALV